jgi:hypothetical protein
VSYYIKQKIRLSIEFQPIIEYLHLDCERYALKKLTIFTYDKVATFMDEYTPIEKYFSNFEMRRRYRLAEFSDQAYTGPLEMNTGVIISKIVSMKNFEKVINRLRNRRLPEP